MVFKKHLTPLSRKGSIIKHRGKGSTTQRLSPGDQEQVTGGDPLDRASGRYPTAPAPDMPPTSAPPLGGPPMGAPGTAMPPIGAGVGPPLPDEQ
jgi:hypothetical protein